MRKKSASGVLASLRGSPYGTSTIRLFVRCGLAGRPFCASCGRFWRETARVRNATYDAIVEFFRSLLGVCQSNHSAAAHELPAPASASLARNPGSPSVSIASRRHL
ncbi:exported protein of unknown function [Nitrospira defluvii]|uniref:Transposase zinc-binding domain-containing protein n=1 Tax=Nitrospira defluvii TaxID=330214 RepID=D8PJJ7_9BACT|nr:exported protein of unknown function [Nitrospira defluvii]